MTFRLKACSQQAAGRGGDGMGSASCVCVCVLKYQCAEYVTLSISVRPYGLEDLCGEGGVQEADVWEAVGTGVDGVRPCV